MTAKRWLVLAGSLVLLAVLAVGFAQLAGRSRSGSRLTTLTLAQIGASLRGSPPRLAAVHSQASELLPSGGGALQGRLAALRGLPLVINKWASWCVPCQGERAVFEHASATLGRSVAFLGIDSADTSIDDGRAFLRAVPVGYPSYYDRSGHLGETVTDSSFTPVTVFYDRAGRQYIHQGPYPSLTKLRDDIQRYALG